MAIDERLLTLQGMREVVEEGEINYTELASIGASGQLDNLLDQTIDKLKEYIKRLEKTEDYIFQIFGISGENREANIQILNTKFQEFFNSSGLGEMVGPKLYNDIVKQYTINREAGSEEFYSFLENNLSNVIMKNVYDKTVTGRGFKEISNNAKLKISKKLLEILSSVSQNSNSGIKIKVSGSKMNEGRLFDGEKILYEELTKNRIELLKELEREYRKYKQGKRSNKFTEEIDFKDFDIDIEHGTSQEQDNSTYNFKYNVNYYEATQGKKGSEATQEDIERLRKILKEQIPKYFQGKYSVTSYRVLEDMLIQDPYAFFAGKSETKITGIIGEFCAAAALNSLIPTTSINNVIQWVATSANKGKDLSTDFIIKFSDQNAIGIQVKNTTKDTEKLEDGLEISFVDANIDTVFQRLKTVYPSINFDIFTSLFSSQAFNVPYTYYVRKGGKTEYKKIELTPNPYKTVSKNKRTVRYIEYKNENFNEYIDVYEREKRLIEKINIFFASFAPEFLFMGVDEKFQNSLINLDEATKQIISGNNLYLIAQKPILASSILKDILEELNQIRDGTMGKLNKFNIQAQLNKTGGDFFKGGKKDYATIVEYKQNESGHTQEELKGYLKNSSIRLTSSYKF